MKTKFVTSLWILIHIIPIWMVPMATATLRGASTETRATNRRSLLRRHNRPYMDTVFKDGGGSSWLFYRQRAPTSSPVSPTSSPVSGRASIDDLHYQGAFRLTNGAFGISDVNYAVGVLAYDAERHSLFIVGHAQQNAIAEYPIVQPGKQTQVQDLPETGPPLQEFVDLLAKVNNPDELDRITGMMVVDGMLYVNAETWYDAGGNNVDTTLVGTNAHDLAGSTTKGLFALNCGANCAGYMGRIPTEFQSLFGGAEYYTGWSSVYSIISRYSLGPSFWTFRPQDMQQAGVKNVVATPHLNYGYSGGPSQWLTPRATEWADQGVAGPFPPSDKLWNPLTKGVYGFFIPNSRTWCVIGATAGLTSGMGYKAMQSNGNECGGPCPYDPKDWYNYYWLYDVDEIANAGNPWEPKPYAYGVWELPFVTDREEHIVIGATVGTDGILYVALANAGQIETYDRPPLILTFKLPTSR